jgi:hypothetical protein
VLCCAVLCCAVLCCAVLCCAVLCCAVLQELPWPDQPLTYYKKYRVYFTEYRPGYHKNIFRQVSFCFNEWCSDAPSLLVLSRWGERCLSDRDVLTVCGWQDMGIGASEGSDVPQTVSPNGGDEYDVPQCAENSNGTITNGSCTHLLTGTWMPVTQNGSVQIAYAPGYSGCRPAAAATALQRRSVVSHAAAGGTPHGNASSSSSAQFALHWGDWCFSGASGHANMVAAGNASDADACGTRCAADAACTAFAFQGLNSHNAPDQFQCYLFHAAVRPGPAKASEGWGNHTVCAVKERQCHAPTSAGKDHDTTANCIGAGLPLLNVSACSEACCANTQCSMYTFTAKQPDDSGEPACQRGKPCCWLKQGAGVMVPRSPSLQEHSAIFAAHSPPPPPTGCAKVYLAAMHGHCHAPTCLRLDIYNNDTNDLICSVRPVYGGTDGYVADRGKTFDEPGYVANPPCMFEVNSTHALPPPLLMNGLTIRVEHLTNSTYGHHGEMGLPQAMLSYDIYD